MGKKRRYLRSPKFAHLRELRFGPKTEKESESNFVEQQKIKDQAHNLKRKPKQAKPIKLKLKTG